MPVSGVKPVSIAASMQLRGVACITATMCAQGVLVCPFCCARLGAPLLGVAVHASFGIVCRFGCATWWPATSMMLTFQDAALSLPAPWKSAARPAAFSSFYMVSGVWLCHHLRCWVHSCLLFARACALTGSSHGQVCGSDVRLYICVHLIIAVWGGQGTRAASRLCKGCDAVSERVMAVTVLEVA